MNLEKETPPLSGQIYEGYNKLNIFNIKRALDDVKSFPEILEIYCNPTLTEGCRYQRDTFLTDLSFILNDFENISIDKFAILFDVPRMKSDSYFVKQFWNRFDKMIDIGNPDILNGNYLYKYSCKWFFDYHIQWGFKQSKLSTCRIEFNPNKANLYNLIYFFSVLKSHALDYARVARIDIAVDYGIYLNPLCWHAKNILVDHIYRYSGDIKTIYFGSNESDVQLRVYDKAFELKKNGVCINNDFWRIEAQINNFKGDKPYLKDIDLISEFNVFERLSFFDSYGFKPAGTVMYNQFVYNARAYGVSLAKTLLPHASKIRYLKYLRNDMKSISFNTPAEIHKYCFRRVYKRFYEKLVYLFELGQNLTLNPST